MSYQNIIYKQRNLEREVSSSYRKDHGIFLTSNIYTVDKILSCVDFNDGNILSRRFLEPSCGNGIFIIRLLEKIFSKNLLIDEAIKFIEESIFFVDINQEMVKQTEFNISIFFENQFGVKYNGSFNGFVFDFTKRIKFKNNNILFEELEKTPLSKFLGNIDYVIGNPPYVSLYGKHDRKKDENQRIYYLNRYSQFPNTLKNGKINYIMLFIEHSIDFLKIGGKLSFIIDIAFFETAYEHTRKYLLQNTKILSIEINIKDFEVASGQIILTIQKEKVISNEVKIIDSEKHKVVLVDQKTWLTPKDQYKFRFNSCAINQKIADKIKDKGFPTLKELYPNKNLRTCVMLLDMEDTFVFEYKNESFSEKIYPYYQGSRSLSGKFSALEYTKYFHYKKGLQDKINFELKKQLIQEGIKNKKRLGLGETIIYDNPKVYIRQSAKEIIATYDSASSAANNSLYVFSLRSNDKNAVNFLKFLCGYLNSELITFYAQQMNIIRYSKGKQPQIKVSDLYTIPIPINQEFREKISEIVEDIYINKKVEENIDKINSLVYSNFGIKLEEIKQIRKSIKGF